MADRTNPVTPLPGQSPENPEQSIASRIRITLAWLRQAVTEPQRNLDDLQRRVRNAFEIARFCLRHLSEDRAPQMAASLAFRTLFGILPVLVVATIAARSLLGDRFQDVTHQIIAWLGLNDVQIIPPEIGGVSDTVNSIEPVGLGAWLDGIVATASRVDISALGWVGVAVVIFSALWVMVTIENSFNVICRARTGRSWTRRLLVYWCVLTFGPVMLGIMPWLWGSASVVFESLPNWVWLGETIKVGSSLVMFWLVMLVVYMWVPNARVHFKPALVGAFVAAVLLEVGKRSLGAYMSNAFSMSSLYGSLGLIPVFMFWMYLMWMFVLVGLEVAAILQALRSRNLRAMHIDELGGLIDPAAILLLMAAVSNAFQSGKSLTPEAAIQATGLQPPIVNAMLERLEQHGFLHAVEDGAGFTLARPPKDIPARALMDVAFELVDDTALRQPSPLLAGLRDAQRQFTAKTSLASFTQDPTPIATP